MPWFPPPAPGPLRVESAITALCAVALVVCAVVAGVALLRNRRGSQFSGARWGLRLASVALPLSLALVAGLVALSAARAANDSTEPITIANRFGYIQPIQDTDLLPPLVGFTVLATALGLMLEALLLRAGDQQPSKGKRI